MRIFNRNMRRSEGHKPRSAVAAAIGVISAALLLSGCGGSSQAGGGESLAGETVELVVPAGPGGGSGATAEVLAQEIRRLSEGETLVQPVYIEGGATVMGMNDFAQREADGKSIAITTGTNNFYYNYGEPAAIYDYEEWTPFLGLPQGRFVFMRDEFLDLDASEFAALDKKLVFGHMGQLGAGSIEALLMDEVFEVPAQHIFGYTGTADLATAFQTGEIDAFVLTSGTYESLAEPLIKEGAGDIWFAHPQLIEGEFQSDPYLPDAPTTQELYDKIQGGEPEGPAWDAYLGILPAANTLAQAIWVHSDAPEALVDEWVAMGEQLASDEEAIAEIERIVGYEPVVGEELQASLDAVTSFGGEDRDYILDFIVNEHGAADPR